MAKVAQGLATFSPGMARVGRRGETFAKRRESFGRRRETFAPRRDGFGRRLARFGRRGETFALPWTTFATRWAAFVYRSRSALKAASGSNPSRAPTSLPVTFATRARAASTMGPRPASGAMRSVSTRSPRRA